MKSSVSAKVAFVTGGASGIGAALATKLSNDGADVWIADRQVGAAEELARRLNEVGGQAHAVELDVREYRSFDDAVSTAVRQSGPIDYLFNNAGIGIGGEIDTFSLDDWNDVIDVNLRGVVHGIHAVYPMMIKRRSGHIVNTSSMAGLLTTGAQAGYAATKHAIVAISKSLRLEAQRHAVKVSVLCPGAIQTPILTGGQYGRNTSVSDENLLKLADAVRPISAEVFADRALRRVLRGDAVIVVPGWWKPLWYLERLSPALSMQAAKIALKRIRKVDHTASGAAR